VTAADARLEQVFADLADTLADDRRLVDAMDILVRACTEHTSAVEAAVILAANGDTYRAVASTRERTLDVEEAQIGGNGGPCVDCITTQQLVQVPDIQATAEKWPEFAATAHRVGLSSMLAVPIIVGDRTIAGVNLFLDHPGHLPDTELSVVVSLNRVIAAGVGQRQAVDNQAALTEQLTHALESRVVIEQAKGYLAYRHGIDVSAAFTRLRSYARTNRRALRDVAQAVIDRTLPL
jgi:hypothetical protein